MSIKKYGLSYKIVVYSNLYGSHDKVSNKKI